LNSLQNGLDGTLRVVEYNTAEPDVDGLRAGGEKTSQVFRGGVWRWVAEEKTTDICGHIGLVFAAIITGILTWELLTNMGTPISGLRNEGGRPAVRVRDSKPLC
jgi:hypothetical protein